MGPSGRLRLIAPLGAQAAGSVNGAFAALCTPPQIREHMKNEAVRGQQNQASTDMFQ